MIKLNAKNVRQFIKEEDLASMKKQLKAAHEQLMNQEGPGEDFLGWLHLPSKHDKNEFERIQHLAAKIRKEADVLVVVGIGGSYLGARAVIEALKSSFSLGLTKEKRQEPQVVFAGNNLSPRYYQELLDYLEGKSVYLNVISKSGTTTEPAIAFRLLKQYMEKRYGKEEAKHRIVATTDKNRGALKQLAQQEGYEQFVVPDDVGGRYSVLTAVGLLPIAVAGIDISALMQGAQQAEEELNHLDYQSNPCYAYALIRNALHRKNYEIEVLVNYEPGLHFISEWWKQLYGESEGKNQRGIFPASVDFTADLHSMGQYIQEGKRHLFETVLRINHTEADVKVPEDEANLDQLNFLKGKSLHEVNDTALQGTILAHVDGGVPNLVIEIEQLDAAHLGYLLYFFEKACGISAYLNGVNPFNQPGVEAYKKNMFALLGKPSYEELGNELRQRLEEE